MSRKRFVDWDKISQIMEERKQLKLKIDEVFKNIKFTKRGDKRALYEQIAALRKTRSDLAKQIREVRASKSASPILPISEMTPQEAALNPSIVKKDIDNIDINDSTTEIDEVKLLELEIKEIEQELNVE